MAYRHITTKCFGNFRDATNRSLFCAIAITGASLSLRLRLTEGLTLKLKRVTVSSLEGKTDQLLRAISSSGPGHCWVTSAVLVHTFMDIIFGSLGTKYSLKDCEIRDMRACSLSPLLSSETCRPESPKKKKKRWSRLAPPHWITLDSQVCLNLILEFDPTWTWSAGRQISCCFRPDWPVLELSVFKVKKVENS